MVPRVQVPSTGCFYLEGVLDFCSRCTFSGAGESWHVDRQRVHPSARRRCDGRWEYLKPANCYRFIDTNVYVYNTRARKKKDREDDPFIAGACSRETERESSNLRLIYGNSSSVLYHLRCIARCTMHVHQLR